MSVLATDGHVIIAIAATYDRPTGEKSKRIYNINQ